VLIACLFVLCLLPFQKKRDLAVKTLNKYSEMHSANHSPNPTNQFTNNHDSTSNRTEYIEPGRYASFNISELAGHTMEISTPPPIEKESFDFKPSEINARSTMNHLTKTGIAPIKPKRRLQNSGKLFSTGVQDILATSSCKEIRNIRDSLQETSLPRTADMSFMSSVRDSVTSAKAEGSNSFWNLPINSKNASDASLFGCNNVAVADDEFLPAEKMTQKLLEDEKQWEQEYADIPRTEEDNVPRPVFKAPLQKAKLREKMNFGEFSGFMNDDTAYG
jgi:hypothetical protein